MLQPILTPDEAEANYRQCLQPVESPRMAVSPTKIGRAYMLGLKLSAPYKLAMKVATASRKFGQTELESVPYLSEKLFEGLRELSGQLFESGLNGASYGANFGCQPWWAETYGPECLCRKHHYCPFCFSKRLALETIEMARSAGILLQRRPHDYDLRTVVHYDYWPSDLTDEELAAKLDWELSQRAYFLHDVDHFGAIWSTTLQPPLVDGRTGTGLARRAIQVRTAALLLVPTDLEFPKRRKWKYSSLRMFAAAPTHCYQFAGRVFRYPQRLLFNRLPADAVRAVRLQEGRRMHQTCKAKQEVVAVKAPITYEPGEW